VQLPLARRRSRAGAGFLTAVEQRTGLTTNGVAVVGLAAVLFLIARAAANPALFMLAYGAVALVALAYVLARRRVVVEAIRSQLPTRVRQGQPVSVRLLLTARRTVTTIVLEEGLPEAFGAPVALPVGRLAAGRELAHDYVFVPSRRGVFEIGPLAAAWSDPFALTRRRQRLAEPVQLIVHPRIELADDRVLSREWEDPPMRPPVTKPWPSGFEFYGLRDYVNGDDPRRIVWRATARSLDLETGEGRYLVRESEQGITDRVSLVLDTSATAHSPGDPSETFETAVRVIASLASKHLKDGFTVTVHANDGVLLRPVRGQRDAVPLLDELSRVGPGAAPLRDAVGRMLGNARRDTHIVVVTPHLDLDVVRRLRLLMDRAVSVLLVMVVWEGSDPVSMHRAARAGCNVVELDSGAPLTRVFRHVVHQVGAR
jgi:uncharacterized protein (DUF58 family)